MNKEQIKKAMASLTIAGLVTGVSLTADGCKSKTEEAPAQKEAAEDTLKKGSCGQGSCGQAVQDSTKQGSCGQGSCAKAPEDTTKKGSCG